MLGSEDSTNCLLFKINITRNIRLRGIGLIGMVAAMTEKKALNPAEF